MDFWAVVSNYLVYIPTLLFTIGSIYGNITLYKHRESDIFKKRSIHITFLLNCMYIIIPISICIVREGVILSTHNSDIINGIIIGFTILNWWILLLLLNIRNFVLYFNNQWTHYTLQLEWQSIINLHDTNIKRNKNWFIQNKNKFGSISFISKLFTILHIILAIICIFGLQIRIFSGNFVRHNQSNKIHIIILGTIPMVISLVIAVAFFVIITVRTPFINDPFYIHWETKYHSRLMILFLVLIMSMQFSVHLTGNFEVITGIMVIISAAIFFAMTYISTYRLIHKLSTSEIKIDRINSKIGLEQILSNKDTLDLFMNHISKEFCIEVLLSYIEIGQFQQWCILNWQIDGQEFEEPLSFIQSPENVPKSSIIAEIKNDEKININSAKLRAYKLYEKYIGVGAKYEINISWQMRRSMSDVLDDKDHLLNSDGININDLVLLFEKPRSEQFMLLNYSLQRFKTSQEFEKVLEYISIDDISSRDDADIVIVYS